ncbi:MAG: hypothetical protein VXW42_06985 [Planctomycetota bacterium]|nr:hypothetical protein [Planctomycetota bacterium]
MSMATGRPPTKASLILGAWDPCVTPCATDLDGNGVTGCKDLLVVLANWFG